MAADHDDHRAARRTARDALLELAARPRRPPRRSPRRGRRSSCRSGSSAPAGSSASPDRGSAARPGRSAPPDSLVPTPEMGIHGVIEFGNRMLTFVLVVVAIVDVPVRGPDAPRAPRPVLAVARDRPVRAAAGDHRRHHGADEPQPVRRRTALLRLGRAGRAVGGARGRGSTPTPGPRVRAVPRWYAVDRRTSRARSCSSTVVVGILVTGSGPHAGDGGAARNGLNPEFMQHVHSWPAYITARAARSCCSSARGALPRPCGCGCGPACCSPSRSLQIAVGLWQARTGLPIVLVNIHMVLAVLLVAAMTAVVMHLKSRRSPEGPRSWIGRGRAGPSLIATHSRLIGFAHVIDSESRGMLSDAASRDPRPTASNPEEFPHDRSSQPCPQHPVLGPPRRLARHHRLRRLARRRPARAR